MSADGGAFEQPCGWIAVRDCFYSPCGEQRFGDAAAAVQAGVARWERR